MSIEDIRKELFAFVQRASSEKATPDEVRALPEVARVLLETFM